MHYKVIKITRENETILLTATDVDTNRPKDFIINSKLGHPATNIVLVDQYYKDMRDAKAHIYDYEILKDNLNSVFECNEFIDQYNNTGMSFTFGIDNQPMEIELSTQMKQDNDPQKIITDKQTQQNSTDNVQKPVKRRGRPKKDKGE